MKTKTYSVLDTNFNPIIGLILTTPLVRAWDDNYSFQSHYRSDFNKAKPYRQNNGNNFNPIIGLILTIPEIQNTHAQKNFNPIIGLILTGQI